MNKKNEIRCSDPNKAPRRICYGDNNKLGQLINNQLIVNDSRLYPSCHITPQTESVANSLLGDTFDVESLLKDGIIDSHLISVKFNKESLELAIRNFFEQNPNFTKADICGKIGGNIYNAIKRNSPISYDSYKTLIELIGFGILAKLFGKFDIPHQWYISKGCKRDFFKGLIIAIVDKDLYRSRLQPTPIIDIANAFGLSINFVSSIVREHLSNIDGSLYSNMYRHGGDRFNADSFQRINSHKLTIVSFFKEKYSDIGWKRHDYNTYDLLINELLSILNFSSFHQYDYNVLRNFFDSLVLINDKTFDHMNTFNSIIAEFYSNKSSSLYIELIDLYFGSPKLRAAFFEERQSRTGYQRLDYSDPNFRASCVPKNLWIRTATYEDKIISYLRDFYQRNPWRFNDNSRTSELIKVLWNFIILEVPAFREQNFFHATDIIVLENIIDTIPLLENSDYYYLDNLNKIYSCVYHNNKEASDKFRRRLDLYFGNRENRIIFFHNRQIQVFLNAKSSVQNLLLDEFLYNPEHLRLIDDMYLRNLLINFFEDSLRLNIPYFHDSLRCSNFRIRGSDKQPLRLQDFSNFVKNLINQKIIDISSNLGGLLINYIKAAIKNFDGNHILFSRSGFLLHPPLLRYILYKESSAIAIELPIVRGDGLSGHIDLIIFYQNIIYICDYKPNLWGLDKFRVIPQICSYALILKDQLKLNYDIQCVIFSDDESWSFSPDILKHHINPFVQQLSTRNQSLNFNWKDTFFIN